MSVLRIEYPVPGVAGWKHLCDSDPVGREKPGVRRDRVLRPIQDAKEVMIDLAFEPASQADTLLAAMRVVWGRVGGKKSNEPPGADRGGD